MMSIYRIHTKSVRFTRRLLFSCSLILISAVLCGLFVPSSYAAISDPITFAINASGGTNNDVAVDPVYEDEKCSAVLYDNSNGLQTSEANAICQTDEGFIWIGSYSGLTRFDGTNFEHIDSSTGITSVRSLFVDSRNRLWIGTNDNGLVLMDNGTFINWDRLDGLPSDLIYSIVEDKSGLIYVGTPAGIATIDQDLEIRIMDDLRVENASITDFRVDAEGIVYCLTENGDIMTIQDGKILDFLSEDKNPIKNISYMMPDPTDSEYIYIVTDNSEVYRLTLDNPGHASMKSIMPLSSVQSMEYINDQVWICARNGLGVLDQNGLHILKSLPMNNSFGHVMTDYEGNLWFTSSRQGVMKIVPNRFLDVFERNGLDPCVVNTTCLLDDQLFIGTDEGLIILENGVSLQNLPISEAKTAYGASMPVSDLITYLRGVRIRSIITDSKDRLWISTWTGPGLLCYDHGALTSYTKDEGLFSNQIRTVVEREDGSFLVALTGGVNFINNNRVTGGYSSGTGLRNTETLTVAEGFDSSTIVGTDGGGLYIFRNTGVKHIGREEGLPTEIVMRVKRDPYRDILWIVASNALAYMTKDDKIVTIQNFPYSNNFDIYFNSKDEAWIVSSNGLYVLPTEDLIADKDLEPVHFNAANGLPCYPTSNSYSHLTEDGDLYIAGSTGSAMINLNEPLADVWSLRMAIPYIDADGERIYPDKDGNFVVSGGTQKVTIYPFVFNYFLIDPQVVYRLKQFDRFQTTISCNELVPINYTNLPGGTYHFIMEVKDPMGHDSRSTTVRIDKERAFYEQVWFYIVAALALLTILGFAIHHYVLRRIAVVEARHREESERQRIHSELDMAARIQASMLPPVDPPTFTRDEFDIYAVMDPAREVGGDFYDFFMIDEDHLCLVMADVSGKGIPASLFMMISKAILQSCAMLGRSPADILTKTNEAICSNNTLDMFVTVWVGVLELSTGKLVAANAGHEYPVMSKPDGHFELIKDRHGLVIGGMDGIRYKEYDLQIEPGSKLFLYTDGVPEATDAREQLFGSTRMLDALNTDPKASPHDVLKNVRTAVDAFVKEAEQFDDLTMLCIEYKGPKQQ